MASKEREKKVWHVKTGEDVISVTRRVTIIHESIVKESQNPAPVN
jgi:hypothetical protein